MKDIRIIILVLTTFRAFTQNRNWKTKSATIRWR